MWQKRTIKYADADQNMPLTYVCHVDPLYTGFHPISRVSEFLKAFFQLGLHPDDHATAWIFSNKGKTCPINTS